MVKPRITRFMKTDEPLKVVEAGESPTYTHNLLFPRYALLESDELPVGSKEKNQKNQKKDGNKKIEAIKIPHSILREFGSIRSGYLSQDVSLGMTPPELISNILKELGPPDEFPSARIYP